MYLISVERTMVYGCEERKVISKELVSSSEKITTRINEIMNEINEKRCQSLTKFFNEEIGYSVNNYYDFFFSLDLCSVRTGQVYETYLVSVEELVVDEKSELEL